MTDTANVTVDCAIEPISISTGEKTDMNGSTTATSAITTIDDASHFAQTTPDSGDARPTTSMFTTMLDRNHFVTIEVVLDRRHDGDVLPFWKGYVLEHGDLSGSVAVGFARAFDDSDSSRLQVIVRLNEVVRRNSYLLYGAEDLTTGKQIECMPFHCVKNSSEFSCDYVGRWVIPSSN